MNKPKGRLAKRMAFYSLNRRKSQGRSVLKQIRSVMPIKSEYPLKFPLFQDEWDTVVMVPMTGSV